jgi:NADH-quinone oxidoreductase subunit M
MSSTVLVMAFPILGAGLALALRSYPRALKVAALLLVAATAASTATGEATAGPLSLLVVAAAFLAVLGQRMNSEAPLSVGLTLLILGLSLGALGSAEPLKSWFLGVAMGMVGLALLRRARTEGLFAKGSAALFGIGIASLMASALVPGPLGSLLRLAACAILLPLFPLHGAYVGALGALPGTLPAFLAVALPILGWQRLTLLIPHVPAGFWTTVLALALLGAFYGFMKALVQSHLGRLLAYANTILFAIAWWHVAATGGQGAETALYVSAVGLAMTGLLLAGHQLEARYGALDLERLQGLARPMPRFATLVGLLMMAAMGLPLFGVFSGFMAMMFSVAATAPHSTVLVLLIWFLVSWLFVRLLQLLLCGQPRPDWLYRDLGRTETLSLILVLCLLALGGFVPADLVRLAF